MPAVSFAKQFAEAVKNGTKRQTIRRWRTVSIAGVRYVIAAGLVRGGGEDAGGELCETVCGAGGEWHETADDTAVADCQYCWSTLCDCGWACEGRWGRCRR